MAAAGPAQSHRLGNLPAEAASFVGRRRETGAVKRMLSTSRLVTLTGVGGVGKTRLALRTAAEVRRLYRDGVWLVDLADLTDPDLPAQVAGAVGLRLPSGRPPLPLLSDHLADHRLLLVLDTCEHRRDACAALVLALLEAAPELRVLATSRRSLGLDVERILPVAPLSLPDPDHLPPFDALGQYEGLTLFAERAAAVRPGFAVTPDNGDAVVRVCRRLDGIPLAIELAARRLRALSVEQLLARLDHPYRLLTDGARAAAPRHRTLRALMDWSYALCSPQEQVLWPRLSVFADTFDASAAEAVCGRDGIAPGDVPGLLDALVDTSILTVLERSGQVRYRMLGLIRHYGHDRLAESGQASALREHPPQAGETTRVGGAATAPARLTRRETEIAGFAARGLTNKDIAAALVISQRTVEAHIDHILGKLGFNSRAQIAAWVAGQHAAPGG